MKKIAIVIATLIAFSAAGAFADDALVLPAGVFRITTALSYAGGDVGYDVDGDEYDLPSAVSVLNFGAALEYGVNDWISAAFQWAPGYNVWSEIEDTDLLLNGSFDLFAGAKIQIVGPKALVPNEIFRFAVAPGIKIPLPGADFEAEVEKAGEGDPFIWENSDNHVLGLGARVYADYVVNKMFFMNLFGEFTYYPVAAAYEDASLTNYGTAAAMGAFAPEEIAYHYDMKLEAEPHFEYMVADGFKFSAGLPITYTMSPNYSIDDEEVDDTGKTKLSVGPNASMFFMKSVVPFELKLAYILPVMGTNTQKFSTFSLQAKVYLKF